ncbi:MAG: flagellin [Deltaproteobacteria bacterium]|nr:flagellin [Deltaproteobacteria bacterium]
MGLVINHNMMAMNAARNLSSVYKALAKSTAALSSGLRVMSAADDAAGLAVRELMRVDIAVINQGLRNAGDAISMIQTAEGALGVIDEKLIRMKELAEQAATGTYTTVQREIMDSEFQAMAAEIDRIANATEFNGVKVLNGDLASATLHDGSGLKVHFGTGNSAAEDYYFIKIDDMRATESTGLQIGGGATADIWTNETSYNSLSSTIGAAANDYLTLWYNASANSAIGNSWASAMATAPEKLVGIYEAGASTTLQNLIDTVNQGTAARIQLDFATSAIGTVIASGTALSHVYVGNTDLVLVWESAAATSGGAVAYDIMYDTVTNSAAGNIASDLVTAFNAYSSADTFAILKDSDSILFFAKQAGVTGNTTAFSEAGLDRTDWLNLTNNSAIADAGNFSMGGLDWITASYVTGATGDYSMTITGDDRGADYDLWAMDPDDILSGATGWSDPLANYGSAATDWSQTEGTGTGGWDGADILTQSAAQLALNQLDTAIETKDKTRAGLGALQNRLENTISVLAIQAENLQAAESRISDIDVALEMTQFTKNMIMAQAATSMLAQANGLAQLALSVLG